MINFPLTCASHEALVRALLPAVLDAARVLLKHRSAGFDVEHKADKSPVTAADREAESVLLAALGRVVPRVPIIAEEEVAAGRVPDFDDTAFLVDALDGTREFVKGGQDFTVNIGLVTKGAPVMGILMAPVTGRLFATLGEGRAVEAKVSPDQMAQGAGAATIEMREIRTSAPDMSALRVLASRSHRSAETDEFLAKFKVGHINGVGSSVKFGLMAAGEADLYPRCGPTSAWDIAAGHAILQAAGGEATTMDGQPLRYLEKGLDFRNPWFVAWARPEMVPHQNVGKPGGA